MEQHPTKKQQHRKKQAERKQRDSGEEEEEDLPAKKRVRAGALADWGLLPPSDKDWIRGLLDSGAGCELSTQPCMQEGRLLPLEVSNLLNAGKASLLFYAYITHAVLCPRHLCLGRKIHCHGTQDKVVAACISQQMALAGSVMNVVRLFVRCFSAKCEVCVPSLSCPRILRALTLHHRPNTSAPAPHVSAGWSSSGSTSPATKSFCSKQAPNSKASIFQRGAWGGVYPLC